MATLLHSDIALPFSERARAAASFAFNLLVAGHATTRDQILGSMRLLLEDLRNWETIVRDERLIAASIDETLRLEPALPFWIRRVGNRPVTFGQTTLDPGTRFAVSIVAANRDERHGDWLNPFIKRKRSATFGHGPHQCLGEGLARIELKLLIETLVQQFPRLRLARDYKPRYGDNAIFRELLELEVTTLARY